MRLRRSFLGLLAVIMAACGGGGGGGGAGSGGGGNNAPVFTSAANVSVAENVTTAFYTATATDADGAVITFSIAGGTDSARFAINTDTGALSFVAPPDFELAADSNADSVYGVTLAASDGVVSVTLPLTVSVTNVAGAVATRRVASGLAQPLFVTAAGVERRVLVVERAGVIRLLDPTTGMIDGTAMLNVSTETTTVGERGLLGFALAPDFATSGAFYVHMTNLAGNSEVRRYVNFAGELRADPASANVIFTATQPAASNHKGGWIGFGPDGLLYIALGDGGGAGDTFGNGQNPNSLLAKILRVDPRTDAFPGDANRDYAIPAGNPFASGGGAAETWVWGLRNPFRNSFDRATGNLLIGDVGQGAIEEIDLARASDAGANYGWSVLEGTQVFAGGSTAGLTPPVAQYAHGTGALQGNSVTGGYVYRGPIAALQGIYFFGDFVNSRIWSLPVSNFVQGATIVSAQFTDRTASFAPDVGAINSIASFGEDARGNLYIVDIGGEIFVVTENE